MKILWCWRCKMEIPMLEEEEYNIAHNLYGEAFGNRKSGMTRKESMQPLLDYYKEVTGFEETEPLFQPQKANMSWSMDFMSDSLTSGKRVRVLNIIDDYNREALWIDVQFSYPGEFVVRALDILEMERGLPTQIRVDNGPEFISNRLRDYCKEKGIKLAFIKPGKPTQNAYVERFNRLFREDVLDAYLFDTKNQLQVLSDRWRNDYNNNHPHKSLGGISPNQYKILHNKEITSVETVKAKMNDSLRSSALKDSPEFNERCL